MLKPRRQLFVCDCFTNFVKTTAPQQVIFYGNLSTIIIFKTDHALSKMFLLTIILMESTAD